MESNNVVIRIHPVTRPKLNAIRQQYPTWSIQSIIDDAIEALANAHGVSLKTVKTSRRKTAA